MPEIANQIRVLTITALAGLILFAFTVLGDGFTQNDVTNKCVGHETRAFITANGISTQYDPTCK